MSRPIVVGAGPAGSAAAILLARGGAAPILVDRDAEAGDALCGGFISWETAARLKRLGFDPMDAGGHPVTKVAILVGGAESEVALPAPGFGLSRRAMDSGLRSLAQDAGADFRVAKVRHIADGLVATASEQWESDAIFLATGKHDLRGMTRPRRSNDPALGIRLRGPVDPSMREIVGDRIELHPFDGGYAGVVLQEEDSINICLSVRKSLLSEAGGSPLDLLALLARDHPALAARMAGVEGGYHADTIGAVPYGWIATTTPRGIFRLGDQAAVIPSLAGEGMGIALASAAAAAGAYLDRGPGAARAFQRKFAARARRPLAVAGGLWAIGESASGGRIAASLAARLPAAVRLAMRASRI